MYSPKRIYESIGRIEKHNYNIQCINIIIKNTPKKYFSSAFILRLIWKFLFLFAEEEMINEIMKQMKRSLH